MKGVIKEELFENILEIWSELADEFVPPLVKTKKDFRLLISKVATYGKTYSCRDKGHIQGAVSFYANDHASKIAYISLIATAESARGMGIGHILLEKAIEESLKYGMSSIRLEVKKGNDKAFGFYLSHGFSIETETCESVYMILNIETSKNDSHQ